MSSRDRGFHEFGPFILDARERVLLMDGATVGLTPKEIDLLTALVRNAGRVISKEELLREVWPDTFVSDKTLAQNVFTLRKALARADAGRQYVETVPRRGYRFCAPVREVTAGEAAGAGAQAGEGETFAGAAAGVRAAESAPDDGRASARDVRGEVGGEAGEEIGPDFRQEATRGGAGRLAASGGFGANGADAHAPGVSISEASPDGVNPQAGDGSAHAREVGPAHDEGAGRDGIPPRGAAPAPNRRGHPVRDAVLIAAAVLLFMAALVYGVFRFTIRPQTARRPPAFQSMKVTRLPVSGEVYEAAVSPDGKYLAYVAPEANGRGMSVWIRQVSAAGNAQRIVEPEDTTFYNGLGFSPDGQHVLFGAFADDRSELRQAPSFGGAVRVVLEGVNAPVSFSPDGRRVAYTRGHPPGAVTLYVADADGANERRVAERRLPSLFGLASWSPDGERLAVAYGTGANVYSGNPYIGVAVLNVADGAETRLTPERWVGVGRLSWLPDGAGLVLSAAEQELSPAQLWQVSYPAGEVRRVTNDLNSYAGASLTADGSALVAVQTDRNPNVWVAPGGDASRARQITSGAGRFDGAHGLSWAPDGRIVYASIASGSWDIWVMNADGTGQKQLTVGARSNYGPSVSADGRHVVFISNRAGAFNIWRMGLDGSNPVRLTNGSGENFPHVTPDNRWVVYATYGFEQPGRVWKVPLEGGEPIRLTDKPSSWPFVSPDGKFVACVYNPAPGSPGKLAVLPVDGGEPVKLFDIEPSFRANVTWTPDNRGLAFLDVRSGTNNVWMQPLAGGRPVRLTNFTGEGVVAYDYSPDGRQLAAARSAETTGVVLIRDFR